VGGVPACYPGPVKAVLVRDDTSRTLDLADVPRPAPGPAEVLVAVHATAVNRADLLQRRGLYPPPPGESDVLGLEAAGVVAEVGRDVTEWRPGDRVFCLLGSGGYAEYVTVHHAMLLRVPERLDLAEAASIPEAFYTAFVNLFLEGGLAAGERVLVHAGASGVGTAAIQLARAAEAEVIVTAGTDDKVRRCRELGAHAAVNYKTEDFAERVAALTGGGGVDLVLDSVGGSYLERHLGLLRPKGRLVLIGLMGGARAELNLAPVVAKRLRLIGSTLRSRALEEKIAITRAFEERVLPLLAAGRVRPVIDATWPLAEAAAAHDYVAANKNFGKVVLTVRAEEDR
jgi:putative PIG3 family NAD(P)H quinone oxidoreductase